MGVISALGCQMVLTEACSFGICSPKCSGGEWRERERSGEESGEAMEGREVREGWRERERPASASSTGRMQ